jgi:hypothetical protein
MSRRVTIAGHAGKIVLDVFGYENPTASDYDDANWLDAKLTADVGPFSGTFAIALRTTELVRLCSDLEPAVRSVSGHFSFESTETNLAIEGHFGHGGSVELTGAVRPPFEPRIALHFRLESDQSFLSRTVDELNLLINEFPVKDPS